MKRRVVRLASLRETRTLGRRLGRLLHEGDFVGLEGELGAGKTELVRAICQGAGVASSAVSSPTFAILATYPGQRLQVLHADLYRLGDEEELFATGFFDTLATPAAAVVEWIDRIPQAAPADHLHLLLAYRGPTTRTLTATAHGACSAERLAQWLPIAKRRPTRPGSRRRP